MAAETTEKTAGGEVLYNATTTDDDPVTKLYRAYGELTDPSFAGDKAASFADVLAAGEKDATPQAKMVRRGAHVLISILRCVPF